MIPILVFMTLFCGLFATVSATPDLQTVPWKGTVFIGEEQLDITDAMRVGNVNGTVYSTLVYFSSGSNPSIDTPEMTLNDVTAGNFYISPAIFTGKTGAWYVRDGSTTIDIAFYVESPILSVKIWNINTNSDVTGQSVPKGQRIDFKIDTNLYPIQARAPGEAMDFDIIVTNPEGTQFSSLSTDSGYRSLENIDVESSLFYWAGNTESLGWNLEAVSDGSRLYGAGEYAVELECDQNSIDVDSSARTFTIATDTLQIEVYGDDDRITRGTSFTIQVIGQPKTDYYLFVKSTQSNPAPYIILNQKNVERGVGGSYITESGKRLDDSVPTDDPDRYYAKITLDSGGKLSVGFQTNIDTDTKKYTLRVENKFDGTYKSDEVYITVTEGIVSVMTEGDSITFLGDQIELTGVNTESDTVYLFLTGPNLPSTGGKLTDPTEAVINGNPNSFDSADIDEDDEYEFTWDTDALGIDSGTYTVYAVAKARDKGHLTDTTYDTLSITLKKPYLSASMESTVANGDKLYVRGTAGTETSEGIAIWILGKNYATRNVAEVESDATFDYEIDSGVTSNLASGQYYVVVQHPMYNNIFDVTLDGQYVVKDNGDTLFKIKGAGSLQGSDAAYALVDEINSADIDDIYISLQFSVDEPTISIDPIPNTVPGEPLTVSGVTNLRSGDELLIEIVSSTFEPTKKTQSGEFSGGSQAVVVKKSMSGYNTFSAEFATGSFALDTYIVQVTGITVDGSATRTFNMVASTPTPTPTPTTLIPTTKPTTIPPTATPTESPGFGAVIAVGGLVVVGYLTVRKP